MNIKRDKTEDFKIGRRIKKARKEIGMTQEQLSKKMELSKGTIANYEVGVQSVPLCRIVNLCDVLMIDPNKLLLD